ncbi:MAG: hypothetical protein JSV50_16465 [Desulfobacteraceae bacterium]|nr:MAG: hypothetical protein JSV50_16465 [Desulfobacteraceae bacterium]
MIASEYNRDQIEAFAMVRQYLRSLSRSRSSQIKQWIKPYLRFRDDVAGFQRQHFSEICTQKCFTSQTSACCNREGIATFFADVVINVLLSSDREVDALLDILSQDRGGFKCVYLTENGCLWRLKPIVCEMFLCKHAKDAVLENNDVLGTQWEKFRRRERRYTWPSRPVLFDKLEELFIRAGFDNPLMYFHHSPGLLRVKNRFMKKNQKNLIEQL